MSIEDQTTEHTDYGWIDFAAVRCDFCGRRHPESGAVEFGMLAELTETGWSHLEALDMCPDCHRQRYAEAAG